MKRILLPIAVLILCAVVAAKLLIFELPTILGDDMAPTLQRNDRLLANRLPREPKRGQLVLVAHPQRGHYLIRRVVALPGETIAVIKEVPVVEGQPAARREIGAVELRPQRPTDAPAKASEMTLIEERIGTTSYPVLKDPRRRSRNVKPVRLGTEYYVLSDNRNHGRDSRDFGPIAPQHIRAVITHRLSAGGGSLVAQPDRPNFARLP